MGIRPFHAELIIREHLYKNLPKTVHLLGKQTVMLTHTQAIAMLKRHGLTPATADISLDCSTLGAIRSTQEYISDESFFRMLGVQYVLAIDCSDYEGAQIVCDLNQPLNEQLYGTVEFLYGGSVLDNVFDPAGYIRNIFRLLAVGGRLLDVNVCSFHNNPYVLVSPAWYFDYCVSNQMADCKLYVEEETPVFTQVYGLDVNDTDNGISNFGSATLSNLCRTIVIAEKGAASTTDHTPIQDQYRTQEAWESYRNSLRHILQSPRAYHSFAAPTAAMLSAVPLRRQKTLRYLGCFSEHQPFGTTWSEDAAVTILTSGIRVIEASYGLNVRREDLIRTSGIPLCRGNVTDRVASLINGTDEVSWVVDVAKLGDPASGLPKALEVHYVYLEDKERRLYCVTIDAEAHGKVLVIPRYAASDEGNLLS